MQRNGKDGAEVGQKLVSVSETGRDLTISERTVWRLLAARELDAVRIGRCVRITRASIDNFIARGGSR